MKRRYQLLLTSIILLLLLIVADKVAYEFATIHLTQKDSIIDRKFDPSLINWEGPDIQSCDFSHLWGIFPYQTCYERSSNPDAEYFFYRLTGPPRYFSAPFDLLSGRTKESYRFTLPVITDIRYLVYPDGRVKDKRDTK